MLLFRTLRWKNFLSTGNDFTEIQLDRSPATLITGQNGAGKSTFIDALTFSLFGKPHRSISKPLLINSVNNKDCRVELEFEIGSRNFKVIRGMRPNVFEIYQNDQLINQDATSKDYQRYLEKSILKLDFKSFHQIVVLGSSSFIPFMQLPLNKRREIVENILDIDIFSKMNNILKQRLTEIKNQLFKVTNAIEIIDNKISNQKMLIKRLQSNSEDLIEVNKKKLSQFEKELEILEITDKKLQKQFEDLSLDDLDELFAATNNKVSKLQKFQARFEHEIKTNQRDIDFFEKNDTCPTCDQRISNKTKKDKQEHHEKLQNEAEENLKKSSENLKKTENILEEIKGRMVNVKDIKRDLEVNKRSIKMTKDLITSVHKEISGSQEDNSAVIEKEVSKQLEMVDIKNSLYEKKLSYIDSREYLYAASELLKDTGIKTKIIKEYIPIMNKMINQYLGIMDFFVSFHFDENFNEEIRSRHRDSFKYSSFSEGEKARIDLALLFTWRHVAKLKNSTNTNLLILDETFDSSVDLDGMVAIQSILQTLTDTSVFVISHRESMEDSEMFRSKITFKKQGNFSKII